MSWTSPRPNKHPSIQPSNNYNTHLARTRIPGPKTVKSSRKNPTQHTGPTPSNRLKDGPRPSANLRKLRKTSIDITHKRQVQNARICITQCENTINPTIKARWSWRTINPMTLVGWSSIHDSYQWLKPNKLTSNMRNARSSWKTITTVEEIWIRIMELL